MSERDLPVSESTIVGTHVFEYVLFNNSTETPADVRTGETPAYAQTTVDDAKSFAKRLSRDHDKPYVAKAVSVESQIDTHSKPYSGCVFHHFSIVGGMDMHKAFSAVWNASAYDVDVQTDYQTGTLTITVNS